MLKQALYYSILGLLFIPLLQKELKLFPEQPLQGDFYSKSDTALSAKGWLDAQYQIQKEAYINENFGFRPFFIRLNNQLLFSFFNQSKAHGVVVGKENYLFGVDYIKSYMGTDFIGEEKIKKTVDDLSLINDELKKQNKELLIIITPNKCYYYPEYLPKHYNREGDKTNYKFYTKHLRENNIPFIDFHSWIVNQRKQSRTQLIPKTGIHWSNYAAVLAADSTIKYLRKKTNTDLVDFSIEKTEQTPVARNPDQDIENGSNLLFEIAKPDFIYPVIKVDNTVRKKLKTFIVSDSYYWNWNNSGVDTIIFKDPMMGYYINDVYDVKAGLTKAHVSKYGFKNLVSKSDLIILMVTEGKLQSLPAEFSSATKNALFGYQVNESKKAKFIQKVAAKIKNDKTWYEDVSRKASAQNISVEQMILIDAEYVVRQNYLNLLTEDYIEKIQVDQTWLQAITKKAAKSNISIEEMIRKDAAWMAEQEINN